jgi:leader peptidase (prepilin peptidase) / N-methyltransferase
MIYIILFGVLISLVTNISIYKICKDIDKNKTRDALVSIVTVVLLILIYSKYKFSFEFFKYSVLIYFLMVISIIDYYTTYIYDVVIIGGILIGMIFLVISYFSGYQYATYLHGMVFGIISSSLLILLTRSMGWGDVEVYALCCLYIGFDYSLIMMMLSFIVGSIYGICSIILKDKSKKDIIPFAPSIAISTILVVLTEYGILDWYINKII